MGTVETEEHRGVWEERYSSGRTWSGNPNAILVREAEGLTPGRALDIGCGEGGDAIWLAKQGWEVVGIDIAQNALDLAAEHAVEKGVADQITWERHDLTESTPQGPFDLVSACYFHSWLDFDRVGALRAAAALVAPGGSLLVAGHAGPPSFVDDPDHPARKLPSTDQVLADLALGDDWEVVTNEPAIDVTMKHPKTGEPATRPDNALVVRRAA
ncbi:MAG: class I SAM-dependent methyltransferase [Solirubrobacteraceae bacterium]|nr:class I SAM-dependent methyltransferase [Solirubrobacteraceae bacterium]